MRMFVAVSALLVVTAGSPSAQQPTRTLLIVLAHPDDETPVSPMLARYAREGVKVHMVIVTDGSQGGSNTTIPRGPELARARTEEAACAARALGGEPPVLLGFPDARLGDFLADPTVLPRATQRLAEEIARIRPDVLVTWGADGGGGHPDHRMVNSLVTQLVMTGAPGAPEHLFYMSIPGEAMRAMGRGVPPLVIPQEKHFTTRVAFTEPDLEAGKRAMSCHRTQFPEEVLKRVLPAQASVYRGSIALVPAFPGESTTDLFR